MSFDEIFDLTAGGVYFNFYNIANEARTIIYTSAAVVVVYFISACPLTYCLMPV